MAPTRDAHSGWNAEALRHRATGYASWRHRVRSAR